ncbi:unnamed protein product [Callosobruchus maculatus]|uniref:Uncharacterized protein n=1 Tax=Callosobruchus maculatus TaxID=64391 RepID=A0A653BX25_CALMS|nr:unnamed protein product [Callosobruchus maculatus]
MNIIFFLATSLVFAKATPVKQQFSLQYQNGNKRWTIMNL